MSEEKKPEQKEQELTEEEKKLDAEYREEQRRYGTNVRQRLARVLQDLAGMQAVEIDVTTTTRYAFTSPVLCQAVAAWLSVGAPPVDPLNRADRNKLMHLELLGELLQELGPIIARALTHENPAAAPQHELKPQPSPTEPAAAVKP